MIVICFFTIKKRIIPNWTSIIGTHHSSCMKKENFSTLKIALRPTTYLLICPKSNMRSTLKYLVSLHIHKMIYIYRKDVWECILYQKHFNLIFSVGKSHEKIKQQNGSMWRQSKVQLFPLCRVVFLQTAWLPISMEQL